MSLNVLFCAGSKTSRRADAGSPLKSEDNLSISSNSITGLLTFTFFKASIILPGIAPIYVLLWPLISDSSWTPPKEILSNSLFIALAIDLPSEVLPTPGGPTRHNILGAFLLLFLFNWLTAKFSSIVSFTCFNPKCSSFNIFSALRISIFLTSSLSQGTSKTLSIYDLITPASADISFNFLSLDNSLFNFSFNSTGSFLLFIKSYSSLTSSSISFSSSSE